MKSMQEIVNSIKNDRLRAVAGELQLKLEGLRSAIIDKRKKGERVSDEENVSLKQSLSNYLKKGLSVTLVTAMLASCLAGCEVGKTSENQGEKGKEQGKETTVEDVQNAIEQGKLVIMAPKGEAVSPESCGLGVLSAFDLTTILTDDSAYKNLEKLYNALLADQEYYDAENSTVMMASGVFYMTGGSDKATSVMFVQKDENSGWTQRVISSKNGLVLVSTDNKNDKSYLTGLVEGTLRNDLGLISEDQIEIFEQMAEDMTYAEILDFTRKNFFGEMYDLWGDNELKAEYWVENVKVNGVAQPYSKLRVQMQQLYLPDENGNNKFKMTGDYLSIHDKTYTRFYTEESQAE